MQYGKLQVNVAAVQLNAYCNSIFVPIIMMTVIIIIIVTINILLLSPISASSLSVW